MARHTTRLRRATDRQVLLALAETRPGDDAGPDALATWDFIQRAVFAALCAGDQRSERDEELRVIFRHYLDGGGAYERRRPRRIEAPFFAILRRAVRR